MIRTGMMAIAILASCAASAENISEKPIESSAAYMAEEQRRTEAGDIIGLLLLKHPRTERREMCRVLALHMRDAVREIQAPDARERAKAEATAYEERFGASESAAISAGRELTELEQKMLEGIGLASMAPDAYISETDLESVPEDLIFHLFLSRMADRCVQLIENDPFTPPEAD